MVGVANFDHCLRIATLSLEDHSHQEKQQMSAQRILTLYPYLLNDLCWVFDDKRTGLKEEAFVLGMTEIISRVVDSKQIPNAHRGFAMTFCVEPFEGHDTELHWLRSDGGCGNWYETTAMGEHMEGWLCPALLLLYFQQAPPRIYVRCDPLPVGVNPIWDPPPGAVVRQFVEAPRKEVGNG